MGLLEPKHRLKLMEQFRPDEGFRLDRAVGTTFSLDLLSLLMAPLAMVMFECEDKDEALRDPTAILESLRLTSDRIAIFCQKGRISVPKTDSYLLSYLEPMVIEVEPQQPDGVFHPKTWLLRYVNDDQEVRYRFLCLSRNLTFDRSWDTVLSLDGVYDTRRQKAYSRNRPLSDFMSALPKLSTRASPVVQDMVSLVADEVLRVDFEIPDDFDDLQFHPIGIAGRRKGPDMTECDRSLIISPFLSDDVVGQLPEGERKNVLISRPESLDGLAPDVLRGCAERASIYVMEQAAENPGGEQTEDNEEHAPAEDDPSGLHAKFYILEKGWDAHVLTGSANATTAGLGGQNVEFLTRLIGKRSRVGIDILLGLGKDAPEMSLSSLLTPYKPPVEAVPQDEVRNRLEKKLEKARKAVCRAGFSAKISPAAEERFFDMELSPVERFELPDGVRVSCWPVMLPAIRALDASALISGKSVIFDRVTLLSLTSFFAFKVIAEEAGQRAFISFALNLPVEGMPEERTRGLLQHIIGNSDRFIRYLLFLLADNPEEVMLERIARGPGDGGGEGGWSGTELPLLEEMVRAYSRHPEKLQRVEKLVADLKTAEGGAKVLPEGFEDVWSAFRDAVSTEKDTA